MVDNSSSQIYDERRIVDSHQIWYPHQMEASADPVQKHNTIPTTHPQYRQIAIIIYSCVLLVGIFDYLTGRPPTSRINLDPNILLTMFCMALILMCLLELIHQRRDILPSIHPAVHLVLVILLSGLALSVSNVNYSQMLLLIPILFAELTFPRWVSLLTIFSAFVILFLQAAFGSSPNLITLIDLQGLLIFVVLMLLIWLMARLIKNEWENRLNLQTLNHELKETSAQLAQMAVVNERNRMARDIHDSVGHNLAAVSIQLEMAAKLHKRDPAASVSAIQQAQSATHDALQDVRKSVGALRQSDETFALAPAVELLISRIATDDLSISYRLDGDETAYPHPARLVFFRAIQEGLTNIYKHAAASHVNIRLQFQPTQARLRMIDDGVGFNPQAESGGTGLQGLQERVEALGGTFEIESRLNDGTILDIILPHTPL